MLTIPEYAKCLPLIMVEAALRKFSETIYRTLEDVEDAVYELSEVSINLKNRFNLLGNRIGIYFC